MAYDSLGLGGSGGGVRALRALSNPFRGALRLQLTLTAAAPVRLEVYDARGRRVSERDYGVLGAGVHVLGWEGDDRRGSRAGAGSFWVRVKAGSVTYRQQVVRIE
jgi:flagellar hook assembly protein FlgD